MENSPVNKIMNDFVDDYPRHHRIVVLDAKGEPVTLPAPGDKIGNVLVEKIIGRGSMGVVYKGIETSLEVERAVKIPLTDSSKRDIARFKTESKICAMLDHPNIVKVHSAGYWRDALPFSDMEFINGTDLRNLLKSEGALPVPVALSLIMIVSSALQHAYQKVITIEGKEYTKLLHRDIKPENILISDKGIVKITDFGVAKFETVDLHSVRGMILGTIPYMAPEHEKDGTVSLQTDIYSLGAMFYELLSGKRPFPEGDLIQKPVIIKMKCTSEYPLLHTLVPDIDPNIEKIVNKCMAPDPSKRYQGYSEIGFHLRNRLAEYTQIRPEDVVSMFILNRKAFEKSTKLSPEKHVSFKFVKKPGFMTGSAVLCLLCVLIGVYFIFKGKKTPGDTQSTMVKAPVLTDSARNTEPTPPPVSDSTPAQQQTRPASPKKAEPAPVPDSPQKKLPKKPVRLTVEPQKSETVVSPLRTAIQSYENGQFSEASTQLKAIDLSGITPYQRDTVVVYAIEALYRSGKIREALAFGLSNQVNDGKYHLLLAQCQATLRSYENTRESFEKAIVMPSHLDMSTRRKALLGRARFYQKQYEIMQSNTALKKAAAAWRDFIEQGCTDESPECVEARRIVGDTE